ncbi:hypothetical protein [Acinetobacter sp. ANC 5054]|uniref:hypothetical protein n=1 Tax=Acinetobacter sp. ANC 5054 TaxID=1977877 RepID=UPI00148A8F0E|nr:hypothetical protein [Acinetobacter sp. ANC 5054]
MKKVLVLASLMMSFAAVQSVQANTQTEQATKSHVGSQEVAACTNGFDSVNVCQLLS